MRKQRFFSTEISRFVGFRSAYLLAALFLLCSCSGGEARSAAADTANARELPREDMTTAFSEAGIPLLSRKVSPWDFSLPLAETGEAQTLSGLNGKVVFLNFWATWCGPCRAEMPSMEALYGRYKERGLEILAVNCREKQDEVLVFMKNNNLSFPSALDGDGKVSLSYGIQAIPTTFILDREGNIIARVVGSIDWNTPKIHAALEHLL